LAVKDRLPLRGCNSTASGIPKLDPLDVHLNDITTCNTPSPGLDWRVPVVIAFAAGQLFGQKRR